MKHRIQSIDALRGLVMIIMALDHVRDFFHSAARAFQPDDLARTTTALFFTRWITHICAPTFMFTAGLGAWFWLSRGRTKGQLSRFLWTRGLWLIVLELTVLRLAMNFSLTSGFLLLSVLWALGWAMIALGFLVWLPLPALAVLSIGGIALHNLTDGVMAQQLGNAGWIWNVLHQPGLFRIGSVDALAAYLLVPWIFVMSAGFCTGPLMALDTVERRRWLTRIGLILTAAFICIRALNVYGDPSPWSSGILSFLKCTKYPPSLDFLLMTLGPAFLLLSWLDRLVLGKANPLIVFGRVPLFYFIGHFFLAHILTIPFAWIRYGKVDFLLGPLPWIGGGNAPVPPDYGYPLWVVYVVWAAVVVTMYPLCLWFARLKERKQAWWLSYL